jgi:putative acetyltransferase
MPNDAIRPIEAADRAAIASIIRTVMSEFGAVGPGFAINDPEVDDMYAAYRRHRCAYFVLVTAGRVVGGGGIAPLDGGNPDTCELRKMYFLPEARGQGFGRALLERCLDSARANGFRYVYLETLGSMTAARRLYDAFGFQPRSAPLGATGHFGCDAWFVKELESEMPGPGF